MIGRKNREQRTLFIAGDIEQFIPEDHILKRVDRILDLIWLREEVRECYCEDNGRPGIDPEAAVGLMLAGFFHGIVHDRKLMREAEVNLAIRWFAGYSLEDELPLPFQSEPDTVAMGSRTVQEDISAECEGVYRQRAGEWRDRSYRCDIDSRRCIMGKHY